MSRLAARNGGRNPGRSTLTIGLVASATFLIVAISAFRIDPTNQPPQRDSGDGGFALIGETDLPIYFDLNTPDGRRELAIAGTEEDVLSQVDIFSLRVQPGEDSSCLNLYQTSQPRILGVPEALIRRGGFAWGGTLAGSPQSAENPWLLLDQNIETADNESVVPVVLDVNTAAYSLHKGVGDTLRLDDRSGGTLLVKIVGLLKNSIFQGDLLMSEANFLRYFPQSGGSRFFLVEADSPQTDGVDLALESSLGDFGFDAQRSSDRLESFLAVQNTYLSTFQSLGGLGLLLGTFGLATVQLRNVFERRGELALLRASGFRRGKLARLVMLENALLLIGGLGMGALTALVAILPHLLEGGANLPIDSLAATLALVLVVGLLAGAAAVRATLRAPLLPALRGE